VDVEATTDTQHRLRSAPAARRALATMANPAPERIPVRLKHLGLRPASWPGLSGPSRVGMLRASVGEVAGTGPATSPISGSKRQKSAPSAGFMASCKVARPIQRPAKFRNRCFSSCQHLRGGHSYLGGADACRKSASRIADGMQNSGCNTPKALCLIGFSCPVRWQAQMLGIGKKV
jgi:hypothetical protein